MTDSTVTYHKFKKSDMPEYWEAHRDGSKISGPHNSEQGARSAVLVMEQKKKRAENEVYDRSKQDAPKEKKRWTE